MEFKFSPATKPKTTDGIEKQRAKLTNRIDEQIAILKKHEGGPLPRKSWAWLDESGFLLVSVNYGYKPLELQKGMHAVQCDNIPHAVEVLTIIRSMVQKGGYDAQLVKVAGEIRSRFKPE